MLGRVDIKGVGCRGWARRVTTPVHMPPAPPQVRTINTHFTVTRLQRLPPFPGGHSCDTSSNTIKQTWHTMQVAFPGPPCLARHRDHKVMTRATFPINDTLLATYLWGHLINTRLTPAPHSPHPHPYNKSTNPCY